MSVDDLAKRVLELLEEDAKLTADELAVMLQTDADTMREIIKDLEDRKIICRYLTLVNWDKAGVERVRALIEVRVTPQRDVGFDNIAERIYRFPEVRSMRLISGAYDLAIFVEGSSIKEVAHFVSTKLSTIDGVVSTSTNFVLKAYKQDGVVMDDREEDRRLMVSP